MIHIVADENIQGIAEYFAKHDQVTLHTLSGRDIVAYANDTRPDAILVRSVTPIDARLKHPPAFVATATLGLDHIDLDFIKKHGIGFASAQGSSKHSVAQYVLTAILALRPAAIRAPLTLGIVGLGNIGATLADYARRLGWQVIGYDPFLPISAINHSTLDALLDADVISIHTPLTHQGKHPTHHLFDQACFEKIHPATLIINAARGSVIDTMALMAFLKKGGQAVLDVFEDEPTPSRALIDRLAIATPHIAGYSLEGKLKGTDMIYQAFCHYFGLPILTDWQDFIATSPYHFSELVSDFSPERLCQFYDIKGDDKALRQTLGAHAISASDFDALRKHYHLRREWLF